MALQTSGQISLNDVNVELGNSGTAQIDMNSSAVRGLFGISSGEIEMADGYGAANAFSFTISSNTQQANLSSLATAAGWNGSDAVEVTINSGVYLWSNSLSSAGLLANVANCTITNNGRIMGMGGRGRGAATSMQNAGYALRITASGVTVNNSSGAFIAGGGGGGNWRDIGGNKAAGGGGAGGAVGGTNSSKFPSNGSGGSIGSSGGNATDSTTYGDYGTYTVAQGGGSGGGGGGGDDSGSDTMMGSGAGGGRILPGTGGAGGITDFTGGAGGSAGNVGSNGSGGGGGGGWGARGGRSGGLGGAAISNTVSYTLSNSGTIYGAT